MTVPSRKRLSAAAYQALRNALPVIVWYKGTFQRYLHTALRDHAEILVGLNFNAAKREIADQLVDRLIKQEDAYQHVTLRLMLEIANLSRFPELEKHEDHEALVTKARDAIETLKQQTEAHEQLFIERERVEAERAAYSQQAELQRRFSDEIDDLKQTFIELAGLADNLSQERGRRFERFLNGLFDLFDLEPRLSYLLEREQIDGAFTFDTDDYILEAKWTQPKNRVNTEQANHFATKVRNKGKNALGLIISVSGFTQDAIEEYSRSTPFMTMDGSDLICVLDQRARLDDLLRRKKRFANETGQCYFPASKLFE
jgi:hypothetical protein